MAAQTILFTTVPNGVDPGIGTCRASVVVSPRLRNDADTTLASFPDWLNWPSAVAGMTFTVELPDAGVTVPATLVSAPAADRWAALFTSATPVRSHNYGGLHHRRLWTYHSRHLRDFLADRWGRFGASDPEDHPTYDALSTDNAFGEVGFEWLGRIFEQHPDGDGPTRKATYLAQIEAALDPSSNDPADWSFAFDATALSTPVGRAKELLRFERYHRRGRADRAAAPAPPEEPQFLDFHQLVSLAMDLPALTRLLGLVLDVTFAPPRGAAAADTRVRVVPAWVPLQGSFTDVAVLPYTRATTASSQFRAIAADVAASDQRGGWLKLADPDRFDVFDVDVDAGSSRTRQFADNLTRSRPNGQPFSALTPSRYPLPHQSSGGVTVTRVGRTARTATMLAGRLDLNGQLVDGTGAPTGASPDLFAEQLVRGTRWDIRRGRVWYSLMGQTGEYRFGPQGAAGAYAVSEEGVSATSASTAGGTDGHPTDLYMPDTLMRWRGWSLANHLVGNALDPEQVSGDGEPGDGPNAVPFEAAFTVPPGSLPSLRFGTGYGVRGRVVDLAGNSEPLAATAPAGTVAEVTYHRYEPVEAPTLLLRDPAAIPGESAEVLVIRSENGAAADAVAGVCQRHVVPPQVGQLFAEQHGVIDTGPTGGPDPAAYAVLAALDAGTLRSNPDGVPDPSRPDEDDSRYYPVDEVVLNWLPDPLARQVLVRDLPPTAGQTAAAVAFETAPWPTFRSFVLRLGGGPSTWSFDPATRHLAVSLAKAEVLDVRVSSRFDGGDLAKLGVWAWIESTSPGNLAALRALAVDGRHWMLTPWRTVRLVHAVRTPLAPPDLTDAAFSALRATPGQTDALLQRELRFHRNSTGRVDINATWTMPVDRGPRTPPPGSEDLATLAASVPIDRNGPEPIQLAVRHEFGDTRYRLVTYTPVAVSAFTDFFRESATVTPTGTGPVVVDAGGFESETLRVRDPLSGAEFRQARPGYPATGDYFVDEVAGTIRRTPASTMASGGDVVVSYVGPEIDAVGIARQRHVPSSARPAPPKPAWVLPTFAWSGAGTPSSPSQKQGKGFRIYLERPWWSSGAGELLGVVLWPAGPGSLPASYEPYASQWGFDPVHRSNAIGGYPTPLNFVNRVASATVLGMTLPELAAPVDVAAHAVEFDPERDLWYADVDIALSPTAARSYWPFVRLALCRYQPRSLPGVHLSPVVIADVAQLASGRTMTVSGSGTTRTITVSGRTSTLTNFVNTTEAPGPNRMRFRVETQSVSAADAELGWRRYTPNRGTTQETIVTPLVTNGNLATWSASLRVPGSPSTPVRVVAEELERFLDGTVTAVGQFPNVTVVNDISFRISHVDVVTLA